MALKWNVSLSILGISLNILGSYLQDAFYHRGVYGTGWSDWGFTAVSLRLTGFGLIVFSAVHAALNRKWD